MIRLATMSSVCPDWTLDETIAGMKKYGYAGYEPRIAWGHKGGVELALSAAERKAVRKRFADEGLAICCVATGVRLAPDDEAERKQQLEDLRQALDLAGDLGAPCVRVFGGAFGKGELRGIVRRAAETVRPALEQAQARGVTICLETHDAWCRSNQVLAVIEAVGHPNFQALWDVMHTQRFLESPEESFAKFGSHVRHLHLHDGRYAADGMSLETVALGEGVIDHAKPLRLCRDAGVDAFASLEVIHKLGDGGKADGVLRQYAEGLKKMLA
ncbi:MAG: sugar phosphate isomerase/epimerase [Planctomycetota bacterium]|nr:sugar phosphate isomerase/epimerase [Planctomycetota bacterium]